MTVYERIEMLRNTAEISQGKLEKALGFSNGSISKWKVSTPNPERLKKLADYFNVSVEWLLTGEDESALSDRRYYINEETAEMADKIFHSKELRMLFDAAQDAAPEDLETVHSMLLALKRKERGNFDD